MCFSVTSPDFFITIILINNACPTIPVYVRYNIIFALIRVYYSQQIFQLIASCNLPLLFFFLLGHQDFKSSLQDDSVTRVFVIGGESSYIQDDQYAQIRFERKVNNKLLLSLHNYIFIAIVLLQYIERY